MLLTLLRVLFLVLVPAAALASDPAPTYTVDLTQTVLDVVSAITGLFGIVITYFGYRQLQKVLRS